MEIDLRGLRHPDHMNQFKKNLEGICTFHEDIVVYLDGTNEDIKKFEIYIRMCNAKYELKKENDYVRINISAPFSMCG